MPRRAACRRRRWGPAGSRDVPASLPSRESPARRTAIIGVVPEDLKPGEFESSGDSEAPALEETTRPDGFSAARDLAMMRRALEEASEAAQRGEVPVGAVVAKDDEILATAHNERETTGDPTAHAELLALRRAAERLGGWRLTGCTLYATLEPCPMCAGALHAARIGRLVYAAPDPKAGAAGTLYDIPADERLNHTFPTERGLLEAESAALLRAFFSKRRLNPQPTAPHQAG